MYELIWANKRKSWILFFAMGIILTGLGVGLGYMLSPNNIHGGIMNGFFIAMAIWGVLSLFSFSSGSSVLLNSSGAHEITKEDDPTLYNVVEEVATAAGTPMPRIYIIDTEALNAFATGTKPENSIIAVTAGLREKLNRNELQAVIAHETGHIYNRDILYLTFAGIMLGAIVILSEVVLRASFFSAISGRSGNNDKKDSGAGAIIQLLVILLAIFAPILTQIFYFSLSRKREYLADATAVNFTRDPNSLADALEKIAQSATPMPQANKITAPMYIATPHLKAGDSDELYATHPPIQKRIAILRALAQGTDYKTYQRVYNEVVGKGNLFPQSVLQNDEKQ
ncbi:MAG: M48 family metallopeptidase [Tannerellaceae bacterium]